MENFISSLNSWDCDTAGAMERLLDDEDFYKECLMMFLDDTSYASLQESIEKKDWAEAFEYAHTLKGVSSNLGLSPIYEITATIVADLRGNQYDNLQSLYDDLSKCMQKLSDILR